MCWVRPVDDDDEGEFLTTGLSRLTMIERYIDDVDDDYNQNVFDVDDDDDDDDDGSGGGDRYSIMTLIMIPMFVIIIFLIILEVHVDRVVKH